MKWALLTFGVNTNSTLEFKSEFTFHSQLKTKRVLTYNLWNKTYPLERKGKALSTRRFDLIAAKGA